LTAGWKAAKWVEKKVEKKDDYLAAQKVDAMAVHWAELWVERMVERMVEKTVVPKVERLVA